MTQVEFDLTLASGRVHARRWGAADAPLLLCVPGLSANLNSFAYLADGLAGPERQVVAFDLRGRGRSDVTAPGTYGWDNHARDVLDVATALGADEFDIAGWSLGALIAMRIAVLAGERLRTVALIDHAGPASPAALEPVRSGLGPLDIAVETPAEYVQKVRSGGVIEPWSAFWDTCYSYELRQLPDGRWRSLTSRAAAEEDLYQRWPRDWSPYWRALTMPAVVLRAMAPMNGEPLIPSAAIEALRLVNPSVRVVEAPDSNHFTCMVDPATLTAVTDTLASR
jgi:pimeloyl-ACP methyl ester carboxylesterase